MTPANARAFRAFVPKSTISVACADEQGALSTMELTLKGMGALRIADVMFAYPKACEVLTAFVDARMGGGTSGGGALVEAARAAAAGSAVSVGTFVSTLMSEAPTLVAQLLVDSVERAPGESLDDLIDLIRSQDADVLAAAVMGWLKVNFARGADPLYAAARLLGLRFKAAAPAAPASGQASGTDSTPVASPSDAPAPEATGSTA